MQNTRVSIGQNVADNIELVQKVKNLNQEKFAEFLGVKTPTYKTYVSKNGKRNFPPPEIILKISNFTGFSINEIYTSKLSEKYTMQQIKNSIISAKTM